MENNHNNWISLSTEFSEEPFDDNIFKLRKDKGELQKVLIRFVCEVKKSNGNNYKPSSIWDLIMTIQMVLNKNLTSDDECVTFTSDLMLNDLKSVID